MKKRLIFVNRRGPGGTVYGMEALDALLAASAFDQELNAVFLDDGVYQLKRGQNPATLGIKNFTKTFAALSDFGVDHLYVEKESLVDRGLSHSDLMEVLRDDGSDAVTIISASDLSKVMNSQDVILQF